MSPPNERSFQLTEQQGQEIVTRLNTLCVGIAAAEQVFAIVKILQNAEQRSKPAEV